MIEVGFITNDRFPHFGYSPDGLVGADGLIEVKSRDPHLHIASINAPGARRRHSATVALAEADASDSEIQAVTGYKTLEMVKKNRIRANQRNLSEAAQARRTRT
ncbi:hypothetical protein [Leisingera sp. ANG-Vp]|uniref:hypothetical protein n=1 Tax=Leisingera sp. ANG-Vp TaxID=1577896 RepID=UPI00068B87A3|nr:hypothetical protein [Leisingera sp. ANG-Vp]